MKMTRHNPCSMMTLLALTLLLSFAALPAQTQTFTVLHTFSGAPDGAWPGSLTMDAAGNFYGITSAGGGGGHCSYYGCGTAFKLTHKNSSWVLSTLYKFSGGTEAASPTWLTIGPDGALYGTSQDGGNGSGIGTIFRLNPPATPCHAVSCPWTERVLYRFSGWDGALPVFIMFDGAGNMYGVTSSAGPNNHGTVFEMTRSGSTWTLTTLFGFSGQSDGGGPTAGLILDHNGNLYGTTAYGGYWSTDWVGGGVIFQLTHSDSGWAETVLYTFGNGSPDALQPGPLTADRNGNFYAGSWAGGDGDCENGYYYGCGTIFKGTSPATTLYSFPAPQPLAFPEGPQVPVAIDAAGNIYGSSFYGAYNLGNIFKLVAPQYNYTSVHDFDGSDGIDGPGVVLLDSAAISTEQPRAESATTAVEVAG